MTSAEEFAEFARVMSPRLRRTAFLLCGDWHTAEDLAQTALTKVFVSWRRIRRHDAVHAYTNRILVNAYLSHRRLKRTGELVTGWFPESPAPDPAPETRMVLLDALATLPPRSRAVVVLRYWADLSVEQVADVMGCSPGNVKKLSARALGKLRVLLGEAMAESGSSIVLRWRALAKDRASIVKITGAAAACGRSVEGSGFVISPQHVLTIAHFFAGVTGLHVSSGTSDVLAAKVVLFDSDTDVAILYVPHLNTPPLRFTGPAPRGSDAALAGYPKDGAFRAVPAPVLGGTWGAAEEVPGTARRSTRRGVQG